MLLELFEYEIFEYYACLLFLFRSGRARHDLPKSKLTHKFRDIKACASVKTRRRENVNFIVTNCKIDLNYKL